MSDDTVNKDAEVGSVYAGADTVNKAGAGQVVDGAGAENVTAPASRNDGAVKETGGDYVTGGIVQHSGMVPGGRGGFIHPPATSERARELARRRWDGVSRAARLGIAAAGEHIPDVSKRQPLKVVEYLVEQHTLNAADPSARGSTQSFKQVMELAYPKPEREVGAASVPAGGLQVNIGAELAASILARLAGRGLGADADAE